ncbi:MAG: hypothetical protein IJE12_05255 [Prevotella sp.]|nr:hypothetical protein [Prevotella sp.]
MRKALKVLAPFIVAAAILFLFKGLVYSMYVLEGRGLQPEFMKGDRILVNRWSYGLRTGSEEGLFRYGRLLKSEVKRGDIIAVEDPHKSMKGMYVFRCKHIPGDTITYKGAKYVVPGLFCCANENYYWLEDLNPNDTIDSNLFGYVGESHIIGRVFMVLYNHNDSLPFYKGYDKDRLFLLK